MRYLSVCSGIEAATVAWHHMGWQAAAFSEIEAFPAAVLAHHYPSVPNMGDMTKYKEWEIGSIDLLVGGTPCQSFSVAGLRKGLADPRGNLALVYCGILDRFRPDWFVWENVPGVLSSNRGRDFGSFLGAVAELGYGFAYRVLDAQFFGVAQRRRRVFVVGHIGDWRRAAAVLFERESLRRDTAPSREAGEEVTGILEASFGRSRGAGTPTAAISPTLRAGGNRTGGTDVDTADSMIVQPYTVANCLTQRMHKGINSTLDEGQTPVIAFNARQDPDTWANRTGPLDTNGSTQAMRESGQGFWMQDDLAGALRAEGENRPSRPSHVIQQQGMQVRRLTPVECERLQGFPDGYTNIPWRGKTESPDGPRYKALGNSMAVPVMRWIGKKISEHEKLNV